MAPPKKKAEKMSLGDFLGDQSLGSWADEMEDMPVASGDRNTGYGERRAFTHAGGFGDRGFGDRGFGDRGGYPSREQLPLPNKPPYTAHLGNLSFDATESEIMGFFSACQVTNVRIVEDRIERKPKGFGYVEFSTLDGLKKALDLAGTQFQGRNIRISVAEPPKERSDGITRELNDWTRKGPLPDIPNPRRASERGGSFRNYDAASDAGSERGGSRRGAPMFDDNKVRDFSNWERKGPLSPVPSAAPPVRDGGRLRGGEGPRERRSSPAWGEGTGRSQDGSRPPRREYTEKPHHEREPTAAELDNKWRSKMQPDKPISPAPTPDTSMPPSPAAAPAPAARPRLNLQKRTVSEAPPQEPASASSDAKASPFGAARPIDTAAREKQIEEKRQLTLRQKKEQEDKEREEKRLAKEQETAARAAQAEAERAAPATKESQSQTNGKEPKSKDSVKENGASSPPPSAGKQYQILRQLNEENADDEDAERDAIDGSANGTILGDKDVKPQEIVRDIPDGPQEPAESTTENLEHDGWSVVSKPQKNQRKGGGQQARAIAS